MIEYLKYFASQSNYETYINGNNKVLPNVSYCENNDHVYYNDFISEYLVFEVIEAGTIEFSKSDDSQPGLTIQFSTNGGSTWSSHSTSGRNTTIGTFAVGDRVIFKGVNSTYATELVYHSFGGTAKVNIYGNINSLIAGDNFNNRIQYNNQNTFKYLFKDYVNLLSAENLILPTTELSNYCYSGMFQGCSSLTKAPLLPAIVLKPGCYESMFKGCSNLVSEFKLKAPVLVESCYKDMFYECRKVSTLMCLATDIKAQDCTTNWLLSAGTDGGTFYKPESMQNWGRNSSGIPYDWRVIDVPDSSI